MFHRAVELKYLSGTTLEVLFQDGIVKQYDISVLFSKYPQLKALEDREIFLQGKLSGSGIPIICMPNRLVISIEGGDIDG